jgi:hypothetical protein
MMKVSIQTGDVVTTASALLYAFPKAPKVPEGYVLHRDDVIDGETVRSNLEVAQTGGGKHPTYVYFKWNGVSHYLPKNVVSASGSVISEVVVEKVVAKPAEAPAADPVVPPVEAPAEEPAKAQKPPRTRKGK